MGKFSSTACFTFLVGPQLLKIFNSGMVIAVYTINLDSLNLWPVCVWSAAD